MFLYLFICLFIDLFWPSSRPATYLCIFKHLLLSLKICSTLLTVESVHSHVTISVYNGTFEKKKLGSHSRWRGGESVRVSASGCSSPCSPCDTLASCPVVPCLLADVSRDWLRPLHDPDAKWYGKLMDVLIAALVQIQHHTTRTADRYTVRLDRRSRVSRSRTH